MSVNTTVVEIEKKMFTPALQQAMKEARDAGHGFDECLMCATNAHLNMLVELMGMENAKNILKNQLTFLEKQ